MSRWPLRATSLIPLPAGDAPPEYRVALAAEVDTPVGPRPFYVTHLNWRRNHSPIRRLQLAVIARHIAEHTGDTARAVLCGDFNAKPDSDEIRMLTGLTEPAAPETIFEDAWGSDHSALLATLDLS